MLGREEPLGFFRWDPVSSQAAQDPLQRQRQLSSLRQPLGLLGSGISPAAGPQLCPGPPAPPRVPVSLQQTSVPPFPSPGAFPLCRAHPGVGRGWAGGSPFPPQSKGESAALARRSPGPGGGGKLCSQPLPGLKTGFSGKSPSVGSLGRGGFSGQGAPSCGGKKENQTQTQDYLGCAAGTQPQMCCTAGAQAEPSLGQCPKGFDDPNSTPKRIRMDPPICPELETSAQQGYFLTSPNNDLLLFGAEIGCFPAASFPQILGFQSLLSL